MPGFDEIRNSLTGAWRLAWRDTDGFRYFTLTADGFWRSFAAILLIAPFYFFLIHLDFNELRQAASEAGETAPSAAAFYGPRTVTLLLDWIAYPVVMVFVTRFLGLTQRYATYIIVFNWCSVLAFLLLNLPPGLAVMGLANETIAASLSLVCMVLVLSYRWYIARTALETTGLVASMLVLLEFTISILIWSLLVGDFS